MFYCISSGSMLCWELGRHFVEVFQLRRYPGECINDRCWSVMPGEVTISLFSHMCVLCDVNYGYFDLCSLIGAPRHHLCVSVCVCVWLCSLLYPTLFFQSNRNQVYLNSQNQLTAQKVIFFENVSLQALWHESIHCKKNWKGTSSFLPGHYPLILLTFSLILKHYTMHTCEKTKQEIPSN